MMETIYCTIYRCSMSLQACASRYSNALAGSSLQGRSARPGADDPTCRICPEGKLRFDALGVAGVKLYRKQLADIKFTAMMNQKKRIKKEERQMPEMPETTVPEAPQAPTKPCKKCKLPKPIDTGFPKNPNTKDGRENTCKDCRSILARERRIASQPGKAPSADIKKTQSPSSVKAPEAVNQIGVAILPVLPDPAREPAIITRHLAQDKPALSDQIGGDHYKHFAIQPIEFSTRNNLGFIQGCIVKRICRYNIPGGKGIQDLQKIIHEVNCLIEISGMKGDGHEEKIQTGI